MEGKSLFLFSVYKLTTSESSQMNFTKLYQVIFLAIAALARAVPTKAFSVVLVG